MAFWFAPTGEGDGDTGHEETQEREGSQGTPPCRRGGKQGDGDGELSKGQEYWQRGGERGRHAELREGLPEAISVNQLRRAGYGEDPSE